MLSNRSHSDAHLHHLRLEKWCDGSVSGKMDTWHGTKTTSERSKKKTNPGLAAVAFRAVTGSAWPGPHAPSKYRLLREPIAAARLERATLESMKSRGTSEDSGAHPLARWLAGAGAPASSFEAHLLSIRSVGILGPLQLHLESLHADLEAIHGLDGGLSAGGVVEAHKA